MWIQTYTGKKFDLLAPTPAMVDIRDIAHALSQINRFGGHTRLPYTVAQHSVIVSQMVPGPWWIHGLMHDAAEAYIGDIPRPIKDLINAESSGGLKALESRVEAAIWNNFGIYWSPEAIECVKYADEILLSQEARDLLGPPVENWTSEFPRPPDEQVIPVLTAREAEIAFKVRFARLYCNNVELEHHVEALEQYLGIVGALKPEKQVVEPEKKPTAPVAGPQRSCQAPRDLAGAVERFERQIPERNLSAPAHDLRERLVAARGDREAILQIKMQICEGHAQEKFPAIEAAHLQELAARFLGRIGAAARDAQAASA